MPASILSQDMLAICLFLADGNIDLSMEEVICRAESYQEDNDRHFGLSRSDFRGLFLNLIIFELEIKGLDEGIDDIKLKDVVINIISYYYAHFNDEGEYWMKSNKTEEEYPDPWYIAYWYGYDEKEYQEKFIIKQKMKTFFEDHEINTLYPESVMKFMGEMKITEAVLNIFSRIGESS